MQNRWQLNGEPSLPLRTDPEPAQTEPAPVLSLAPWLALARDLADLLVPVQPRPAFRAELERSLLAMARQQQARTRLAIAPVAEAWPAWPGIWADRVAQCLRLPDDLSERRWVLGAAAVGSAVSLAGILAYVLYHVKEKEFHGKTGTEMAR